MFQTWTNTRQNPEQKLKLFFFFQCTEEVAKLHLFVLQMKLKSFTFCYLVKKKLKKISHLCFNVLYCPAAQNVIECMTAIHSSMAIYLAHIDIIYFPYFPCTYHIFFCMPGLHFPPRELPLPFHQLWSRIWLHVDVSNNIQGMTFAI